MLGASLHLHLSPKGHDLGGERTNRRRIIVESLGHSWHSEWTWKIVVFMMWLLCDQHTPFKLYLILTDQFESMRVNFFFGWWDSDAEKTRTFFKAHKQQTTRVQVSPYLPNHGDCRETENIVLFLATDCSFGSRPFCLLSSSWLVQLPLWFSLSLCIRMSAKDFRYPQLSCCLCGII